MIENNQIKSEGCKYLSKAQRPSMNFIDLCIFYYHLEKNSIGDEGCEYLLQANWP